MNLAAYLLGKPFTPPKGKVRRIRHLSSDAYHENAERARKGAVAEKASRFAAENRERVYHAIAKGEHHVDGIATAANLSTSPTMLHCHALMAAGRVRGEKELMQGGGKRWRFWVVRA